MPESTLLAERYTVDAVVKSEAGAARWLGTESGSGRRVLLSWVSRARAEELTRARLVQHPHLAELLDFVREFDDGKLPGSGALEAGGVIAVSEHVPGRSLHELFAQRVSPVKAVAWLLRLIEATQALHQKGAVHGAISPLSIVAEPEGRAVAPVLSQLSAPALGPYCSPERLKGGAPTIADDVWALHATLYALLAGKVPFDGTERDALVKQTLITKPQPLAQLGINEPALWEIISRGLIGERRLRVTELSELSKALDDWERDPRAMPARRAAPSRQAPAATTTKPATDSVVFNPGSIPSDFGAAEPVRPPPRPKLASVSGTGPNRALPPPLPPGQGSLAAPSLGQLASQLPRTATPPPLPATFPAVVARISKRLSFNPFERKRRVWPLVALGASAGGLAVYIAIATTQEAPAAPTPPEAAATAAPRARAPEKPKRSVVEEREACARSYFPERQFSSNVNFAFVCEDGDFREVARRLFALAKEQPLTAAATASSAKDAASVGLGWYELPAAGIIRKSCCASAPPLVLPETPGWCEQLQSAVRQVADASARADDLAPVARAYDKAVTCLFANRIARPYAYQSVPSAAQRAVFQHFLSQAAISEARR
jgi:serine/threonine protein kinase